MDHCLLGPGSKARASGVQDERFSSKTSGEMVGDWTLSRKSRMIIPDTCFGQSANNDTSDATSKADLTPHQPLCRLHVALYSPKSNVLNMLSRQLIPCRPSLCALIFSFPFKRIVHIFATLRRRHFRIKPVFCPHDFAGCVPHSLLSRVIFCQLTAIHPRRQSAR